MKKIEECHTKCRNLVNNSVNFNEDTLSLMESLDQLALSKGDIRKCQSVKDLQLFKQKTLKDLEKHEELVEVIKQKITSLISSNKQVENSLKAAKNYFREGPAPSSYPPVDKGDLSRKNLKLKDIEKGEAKGSFGSYDSSVFCSMSQKLFLEDQASIKVYRVSFDSIQKEREFRIQGKIGFDMKNFDFS